MRVYRVDDTKTLVLCVLAVGTILLYVNLLLDSAAAICNSGTILYKVPDAYVVVVNLDDAKRVSETHIREFPVSEQTYNTVNAGDVFTSYGKCNVSMFSEEYVFILEEEVY